MNIKTSFDCPPVPSTEFDWSAWIDGQEELGTGHGATEGAAVDDLRNWLTVKGIELPNDDPMCKCGFAKHSHGPHSQICPVLINGMLSMFQEAVSCGIQE